MLQNESRFLRPLNYPQGTPGQGSLVYQADNQPPVAILNLQGRTFMANLENPFTYGAGGSGKTASENEHYICGFSCRGDLRKIAMARMLDGQVSAVIGTHTHVQTADEQIFPGGTAFLTDAGFTGPHESVIGREIEP